MWRNKQRQPDADSRPQDRRRKLRRKTALWCMLVAAVAFAAGIFALAVVLRPTALSIGTADLAGAADGTYIGVCQNKLLFAVVRVDVENRGIADVKVLFHKASYLDRANEVAAAVRRAQSLDVDAVSGATLTRDTVLKAIENALASPADFIPAA